MILVAVALAVADLVAAVVIIRNRYYAPAAQVRALDVPAAASAEPLGPVVRFLRRHRGARFALVAVWPLLLIGAVALLGYPVYTNLYQSRLQEKLHRQLVSPSLQQAYRSHQLGDGDALTRIRIPAINVDVVVVEGTTESALRAGAGHYPQTPLPCEVGNVGIAGHRTTYGKPFHNLDLLKPGDEIILTTPVGTCTYKVQKDPFVVLPTDTSVVGATKDGELTLTTCHPKGSASHRLVVRAVLQGTPASA